MVRGAGLRPGIVVSGFMAGVVGLRVRSSRPSLSNFGMCGLLEFKASETTLLHPGLGSRPGEPSDPEH